MGRGSIQGESDSETISVTKAMGQNGTIDDLVPPPHDAKYMVLITCCMLGVAVLFPWNALITANNFWTAVYGEDYHYEVYLSAVYSWPQWVTLLLVTRFGPRFSFSSRIISTLLVYSVSLLLIPFVCTRTEFSLNSRAAVSLITAFVCGTASSIQIGTVIGLTSVFPAKYVTAAMSGMGIGGVIIGVLAMLAEVLFGDGENGATEAAWVYFATAVIIVLITLVMFIVMMRTEFARYYINIYEEEEKLQQIEEAATGKKMSYYLNIFKKIWSMALSVWFVFFVTLSLFPGLMLSLTPTYASPTWYNLIIPLEFNVFDMIGRSLPYVFVLPPSWVGPLSLTRVIFYPLVFLCVWNPPVVPDAELWMYAINVIFALTNGFLGTLSMMYAPGRVTKEEQQTAGIMMSFFLNFGIFCATNFAVLLTKLV